MDPIDELWKLKGRRTWIEVAKDLGISRGLLSLTLRGHVPPGPKLLKALGIAAKTVSKTVYVRENRIG